MIKPPVKQLIHLFILTSLVWFAQYICVSNVNTGHDATQDSSMAASVANPLSVEVAGLMSSSKEEQNSSDLFNLDSERELTESSFSLAAMVISILFFILLAYTHQSGIKTALLMPVKTPEFKSILLSWIKPFKGCPI